MKVGFMAVDNPLVIAIDSSTTATKAIVVDTEGKVLALGKQDITLLSPSQGFGEHDPRQWWTSTRDAIAAALSQLNPTEKERVAALGITHQRETFAPFTADGTPLRNGILWLDIRATEQVQRYGTPEIHALSGRPADVTPGLYKMAWLKEHEPESLRQADKITTVSAYLTFCLTGRWTDSAACVDSLSLSNIRTLDYDDGLLEIAGVTRAQMPDLVQAGEVLGTLLPAIAEEWGIGEIPVIAGCGDGQAAGVGAAAVTPDIAFLNMGTAVVAGVPSTEYRYEKLFRTEAAGVAGTYVLELVQNSGAYLSTWYRRAFGKPELEGAPDPELEAAAAARAPGSGGLITMPYWGAVQSPHWDPLARGAVVGWRGTHGRGSMYRSILEGICLEMARSLRKLEVSTGVPLREVRGMGGGMRSPLWRQIMTDAIGLPITACREEEISALGAAMIAMASTGVYGDNRVATAAEHMAGFTDVTEPDMQMHEIYQELSGIQEGLYESLRETNARLHDFANRYPDAELADE
ncbi:FGGY family carbohydrate kinase [Actinobaculum sp. 313]|uniref:xylulokinase n=1 Tax=Actinobaculum sp. 313 TaxID=2495645 RepID=UPI000D5269D6|nr:FGGY family carbohydrate kinase [Actinobaculum sp. 313]AWE42961.1 xylulose kinase [Actinobaculum sp. 313]